MTPKILALAALLLTGSATLQGQYCTNSARYTEVAFFDSTQISVGANVQFGTAPDHLGNPYPLRMDLYYPNLNVDPSPKRPFVMLIHGGGFSSGDKQSGDIKDLCVHLARRGFVCASINYRIGHDFSEYGEYKARYRAIQDGHAAMRHIVNSANTIRVDTSWLFVGGQSAGAITALGMVYGDPFELDSVSLSYNSPALSVQLGNLYTSGNTLTTTYSIKGVFNNWGGTVRTEMDANELLPTVAFHDKGDTVVKIDADNSFLHYTLSGSAAIHTTLVAKNVCSELTVDSTGAHGIYRNSSSVFRAQRASCFFKSIFCNSCRNFYANDSIPVNCSSPVNLGEYSPGATGAVYPNPFQHTFQIKGADASVDVEIYDCFGRLVYKNERSNGLVAPDLAAGVYYLKIRQGNSNNTHTSKLIKTSD